MSKFNMAIILTLIMVILLGLSSCGDSSSGTSGTGTTSTGFKKIYLAAGVFPTGDYGVADIDLTCSSGYQALIGTSARHPDIGSGAANWVLQANTEYRRADGTTVIGKTNASAVFTFPLTNSFGSSAGSYYTGIESNWSVDQTKNCGDWGSMADNRTYGNALSTTSTAISAGIHDCGTSGPAAFVLCVEQ